MTIHSLSLARYRRLVAVVKALRGERALSDPEFLEALEKVAEGAVLLVDELDRIHALLRKHEWCSEVNGVYFPGCPECHRTERQGHAEGCAWKAALGAE